VHGNVKSLPASEQAPIAPADWYQETKWQGEVVCREFLQQGMWITIVRPAAIYGPGDPERFVMLFRRAAKGRFVMVGDGSTQYHPLYISNLVEGMIRAMETDAACGKAYLIADARSLSIKDLVTQIGRVLGRQIRFIHIPYWPVYCAALATELLYKPLPQDPPLFRRRIDWFIQNRSFDIGAARHDLQFEPAIGLDEGLARTAEWYKSHGYISI
jgi:nucleoside-diphosphate-sugar epimerase